MTPTGAGLVHRVARPPGSGNTVTVYTYRTDTAAATNITFNLDVTC